MEKKERKPQEYQRVKAECRSERKDVKNPNMPAAPGEDPDIAGIVPGPQQPLEE